MTFTIDKALCDLNTYINKERSNKFMAAKIKREETEYIMLLTMRLKAITSYPVDVYIEWHGNMRKDPDNQAFAIKFILDALVKNEILVNDGFKQINSITHVFKKDTKTYCIVNISERG